MWAEYFFTHAKHISEAAHQPCMQMHLTLCVAELLCATIYLFGSIYINTIVFIHKEYSSDLHSIKNNISYRRLGISDNDLVFFFYRSATIYKYIYKTIFRGVIYSLNSFPAIDQIIFLLRHNASWASSRIKSMRLLLELVRVLFLSCILHLFKNVTTLSVVVL